MIVSWVFASFINSNAMNAGKDGYTFTGNGPKCIFRELEVNASRNGTIDTWQVHLPVESEAPIGAHQLILQGLHHYGASVHHPARHEVGGILYGVLKNGYSMDAWSNRFYCTIRNPAKGSLVEEHGRKVFAITCDGDHTWGRDEPGLNAIPFAVLLPHDQNITRMWARKKLGEWCHPMRVGRYVNGNTMPVDCYVREMFEEED